MTERTINTIARVVVGTVAGAGADVRTHTLDIGGRSVPVELVYVDGKAQPREPDNESYMRGWNAARRVPTGQRG